MKNYTKARDGVTPNNINMEDFNEDQPKKIIVELKYDRLQQAVNDAVENILKNSYGNPIKEAVEKAIKEKGNEVEILVKQLIADSLTNPDFKTKLGEVVMGKMFESAFKK